MGDTHVIKFEWTKANIQELITAFEANLCLYDPKHKLYKNKHARADSLLQILDRLNFCENLRSQHNHELTKIKDSCRSLDSSDDVYEPSVSQQGKPRNKDIIEAKDNFSSSESALIVGKEDKPLLKTKKLKYVQQQQQSNEDAIMAKILQALTSFQDESNKRNADGRNEQFGNYVVSELNEINDVELLIDCKNEINNILYKYKKPILQMLTT
ncbi:hypothetical protein RN001_006176 [Aquatica leii]|uniref:MADF domain-containing protein n=1 Tax=Aquatica leii TaxID=1421715 RepID=A0AAN7SIF7_9COLE|nr:hypothetical protein RN001_006176 [Aquatica leii]